MKIITKLFTAIFVLTTALPLSLFANAAEDKTLQELSIQPIDEYNYVWVDEAGNVVELNEDINDALSRDKAGNYPAQYDARTDAGIHFATANQGSTNCCWAFSSLTALEADCEKNGYYQGENALNLSEAHLAWFANKSSTTDTTDRTYGDGLNESNPYASGGYWFSSVFTLARGSGTALEADFPFSTSENYDGMGNYSESDRYIHAVSIDEAEYIDEPTVDEIKSEIVEHGGVKVSYYSGINYVNEYSSTGDCCYYQNTVTDTSNHAVTVIGWDDSYSKNNFLSSCQPATNGAWLCKNSWGSDWGNDGYFWISYAEPSFGSATTFSASAQNNESVYQYDGFGYGSCVAYGNTTTARLANIFTADKNEKIDKIGFFTMQKNVNYTASLYSGVTDGNPTSGTLLGTVSGSEAHEGFHTATLPEGSIVSAGSKFSVVIALTSTDGSNVKMAVEGTKNSRYSAYSSNPGESFVSAGYGSFADLNGGSGYAFNNACVKAYAAHSLVKTSSVTGNECIGSYDVYTCSICGATENKVTVPAAGHNWNSGRVMSAATCEHTGILLYSCTREGCGETKKEVTPITAHSYEFRSYVPPTCEEEGSYNYKCAYCDAPYQSKLPSLGGHLWSSGVVTIEASCHSEGQLSYTCTRPGCGEIKTENIPVTDHKYSLYDSVQATCTEAGYSIYKCLTCDESYHVNDVSALGHDWVSKNSTMPSCTRSGHISFTCTRCNASKEEDVSESNHTYAVESVFEPSCTTPGYTVYKCTVCGETYNGNETAALGHSWDSGVVQKAATCTAEGELLHTCTRLNCEATKVEAIKKADHELVFSGTTAPTCIDNGYDTYLCKNCRYGTTNNETAALGHSWDSGVVQKAATCTAEGTELFTCTRSGCGETHTQAIVKASHNYVASSTVAANCEHGGYTCYTCTVCSRSYNANETAALGHTDADKNGACDRCGADLTKNCSCNCHKTGFQAFIYKISLIFWKLFGTNKVCECGRAHY